MFTNCEGCTIYEEAIGSDHFPVYTVHHIPNVYWEESRGQQFNRQAQASVPEQNHEIYVAVPAASLTNYIPKYKDLLMKGLQPLTKPPDKKESYTITSVIDCRYGSKAVQHLEVTAV